MSQKQYRNGLVVGKFSPLHKGHLVLLDAASSLCDRLYILSWSNPEFHGMEANRRRTWLTYNYPNARVAVISPSSCVVPPNDAPDEVQREFTSRMIADRFLGAKIDVVVSSEEYGPGLAEYIGAEHVMADPDRTAVPVSGTLIRHDLYLRREALAPRVYWDFAKKVVFMGAESTGKTTIVSRLASALGTVWVPEYGREFYEERGGHLSLEDYVTIAQRHMELEVTLSARANRFLFVDTNSITTHMFSYYYEGRADPRLAGLASESIGRYDHWFLCGDDIPFEQDGWRDCELTRRRMQGMIKMELDRRGIRYTELTGPLDKRIDDALKELMCI